MSNTLDFNWPSINDDLFAEGKDWWHTAIVSTSDTKGLLLAEGFKTAADILVKYVSSTQIDQDALVFPIMFAYRQYLEITIKALIVDGRSLLRIAGEYPEGHNLRTLWNECRPLLEEIFSNESMGPLDAAEKTIEQFTRVDPNAEAYRYSVDRKGKPISREVIRIPLANVALVMDGVANLFGGSIDAISEERQSMLAMSDYV